MTLLLLKRVLLGLIGICVLSQIPFAVDRFRTGRVASAIKQMAAERNQTARTGFRDYKGVVHVHSFLGGHSTGSFDELISAAESNGLDFVVMTEHVSDVYDTSLKTLNGRYGNTLWLGGNELSTSDGDRFLVIDGFPGISDFQRRPTADLLAAVKNEGRIAVLAYPKKPLTVREEPDSLEVLSLNTSAKRMNPFLFFLDALWSYGAYPELTLARYLKRPDDELLRYDAMTAKRRTALYAGNDAHSNIGIHLGDDANNRLIDLKYDRYSMIFHLLRTHVLVPEGTELDRDSLLEALKDGNSYISLDVLGDPSGFGFFASQGEGRLPMGSEASRADGEVTLLVESPLKARLVLLRNGSIVKTVKNSYGFEFRTSDPGAYRTEVYLDALGSQFGETPWIISNPVYVR